jgi:multidrug resistance efflux pump
MYRQQIAKLEQQLKDLDAKILAAEQDKDFTVDALKDMKIDRNDVYSELRRYTRLQWEEEHERVNFEDDR